MYIIIGTLCIYFFSIKVGFEAFMSSRGHEYQQFLKFPFLSTNLKNPRIGLWSCLHQIFIPLLIIGYWKNKIMLKDNSFYQELILRIVIVFFFSLFWVLQQNSIDWVAFKQKFLIVLEAGSTDSVSGDSPLPGSQVFSLCPHMGRRGEGSLWGPF